MDLLAGPFYAAAGLLAVSAPAKLLRPGGTGRALAALRLPASTTGVRLLGVVELGAAAAALLTGGRPAAVAVAVLYAGFAAFVAVALARGGLVRSCGCFGAADSPPTALHLAFTVGAAAVAGAVAASPVGGLPAAVAGAPVAGFTTVVLVLATVGLSYLALTELPRTLRAARRDPDRADVQQFRLTGAVTTPPGTRLLPLTARRLS